MMKHMLDSIQVIDFTNYLPGPYATLRLGNMGATITKIEPPNGDPARHLSTMHEGEGVIYSATNWNKQSTHLNLKDKADQDKVMKMIEQADVVIESYRPGVMEKFGLSYEQVKKVNRTIIYCSISGYGQETQHKKGLGSHDINYMAETGFLSLLTDKEGRPIHPKIQFADYIGGMYASEQILAALVNRGLTNKGCYIDISLTDPLHAMLGAHDLIHRETRRSDGLDELNGQYVCYSIYETKDGRFMALGALEEKFWNHLCIEVDQPNWLSKGQDRHDDEDSISTEVIELFKSRTFDEWCEFSLRVDCCLAPVYTTAEGIEAPLLQERGLMERLSDNCTRVRTTPTQTFKREERFI
ncbi:CaiB/BaiF CoA transferase family protein [Alkalihalophilus sp. As8PL]|uniref:CaiB/BaiF CoA transferase family protein n=1 Tax=Alkalihalophilus sp. As8PL TaxID=3237103 RepID=A0AB39BT75_9BACI